MIFAALTFIFVLTSSLLWWRLSHERQQNALLQAELAKLRQSARRLRA